MNGTNSKGAILQIADYGAPYSGNFIHSLLYLQQEIAVELDRNMILVLPLRASSRSWMDLIQSRKIPFLFIDERMPLVKRFRMVEKFARRHNAILLHSHFTAFDLDAAFVARRMNIKLIWHLHSKFIRNYTLKQRLKDLIKMKAVATSCVDRLVAVSDSVAADAKLRGFPDSKIMTIHNGIDLTRIHLKQKRERVLLRESYDILEDHRVFLLFGWEPRTKGVDLFIEAAKLLGETGQKKILCLIVRNGQRMNEGDQMAVDNPWIRFVRPVENVAELYGLSDCFVSASRSEAFSYAIAEAMAAGLPVISSDIPALGFYKQAGEGYISFGTEDVSELANSLNRICESSPAKLVQVGELNQNYVRANLTVDRWCEKVISLYRALLNQV